MQRLHCTGDNDQTKERILAALQEHQIISQNTQTTDLCLKVPAACAIPFLSIKLLLANMANGWPHVKSTCPPSSGFVGELLYRVALPIHHLLQMRTKIVTLLSFTHCSNNGLLWLKASEAFMFIPIMSRLSQNREEKAGEVSSHFWGEQVCAQQQPTPSLNYKSYFLEKKH